MISSHSCSNMHHLKTSSIPISYKYLLMIVNGASFMARILFLFVRRSSRAFPSSKKFEIYSKYLGATSTLNKCASKRSYPMPIGSSHVSNRER
jgi:hypothetical protein